MQMKLKHSQIFRCERTRKPALFVIKRFLFAVADSRPGLSWKSDSQLRPVVRAGRGVVFSPANQITRTRNFDGHTWSVSDNS